MMTRLVVNVSQVRNRLHLQCPLTVSRNRKWQVFLPFYVLDVLDMPDA